MECPISSSILSIYFFAFSGRSFQFLQDEMSQFQPSNISTSGFAASSNTFVGKSVMSFPFTRYPVITGSFQSCSIHPVWSGQYLLHSDTAVHICLQLHQTARLFLDVRLQPQIHYPLFSIYHSIPHKRPSLQQTNYSPTHVEYAFMTPTTRSGFLLEYPHRSLHRLRSY